MNMQVKPEHLMQILSRGLDMRGKFKFEVQSPQEAADAHAVVCMLAPIHRPLLMAGNVLGICSNCRRRVQHRPHIPVGPKLLCIECCPLDPRNRNVITAETLREVLKKVSH